jgi:hypothetical protein
LIFSYKYRNITDCEYNYRILLLWSMEVELPVSDTYWQGLEQRLTFLSLKFF